MANTTYRNTDFIVPGRPPTPCEGRAQHYRRPGPPGGQVTRKFRNGTTVTFGPDDYTRAILPGEAFHNQIIEIDLLKRDILQQQYGFTSRVRSPPPVLGRAELSPPYSPSPLPPPQRHRSQALPENSNNPLHNRRGAAIVRHATGTVRREGGLAALRARQAAQQAMMDRIRLNRERPNFPFPEVADRPSSTFVEGPIQETRGLNMPRSSGRPPLSFYGPPVPIASPLKPPSAGRFSSALRDTPGLQLNIGRFPDMRSVGRDAARLSGLRIYDDPEYLDSIHRNEPPSPTPIPRSARRADVQSTMMLATSDKPRTYERQDHLRQGVPGPSFAERLAIAGMQGRARSAGAEATFAPFLGRSRSTGHSTQEDLD